MTNAIEWMPGFDASNIPVSDRDVALYLAGLQGEVDELEDGCYATWLDEQNPKEVEEARCFLGLSWVAESRIDDLKALLVKLAKRGKRLGIQVDNRLTEPVATRMAQVMIPVIPGDTRGPHVPVRFRQVAFILPAVRIRKDGWRFVGKLDWKDGLRFIEDAFVKHPAVEEADAMTCHHCGVQRRRNQSFVVEHEDGDVLIVGKSCLRDFVGHDNAKQLSSVLAWTREVRDAFTPDFGPEQDDDWTFAAGWPLRHVVLLSAYAMRRWGWVASGDYDEGRKPTKDVVMDALEAYSGRPEALQKLLTEGDNETAEAALAWLDGLSESQLSGSSYLFNLAQVGKSGFVRHRTLGLAASIVRAYQKATEAAKVESKPAVDFTLLDARERDRVTLQVTVLRKAAFEGYYGAGWVVTMVTDAGARLVWFASRNPRDASGEEIGAGWQGRMACTVKRHEPSAKFDGKPQTLVNRCKAID